MEGLYEWVRNIAYYLIFITVVTNLLPNHKYEKYMKLFAGIVCILLVLKPFTTSLRLDDKLAYYFGTISFQKETEDLKHKLSGMENERLGSMVTQYQEAVAMDLERMVNDQGLYKKTIEVKIQDDQSSEAFGMVCEISMVVSNLPQKESEAAYDIRPIDPVVIGSDKEHTNRREERQNETTEIQSLRTRIAQYYGLEAQKVEIRLENGEG